MASPAQCEANRANAQASTGPSTVAGKSASAATPRNPASSQPTTASSPAKSANTTLSANAYGSNSTPSARSKKPLPPADPAINEHTMKEQASVDRARA